MFKLFKRKKDMINDVVKLNVAMTLGGSKSNGYVESIYFDIIETNSNKIVGYCDLRLGMNRELYYLGQVGYHIYNEYRGNYFAYYACLSLFKIAKNKYMFDEILITCNPDNIASYKTLTKLNGTLKEIVDVPMDNPLYIAGDKQKCIFIYNLRG